MTTNTAWAAYLKSEATASAIKRNRKHFRIVPRAQYYRLVHVPSGDYIQRHLCDFLTRKDAIDCRNRVLAAAGDWDWSDPGFTTEMPSDVHDRVWGAIYANPRRQMQDGVIPRRSCTTTELMKNFYEPKPGHIGTHNWTPECHNAPFCKVAQ